MILSSGYSESEALRASHGFELSGFIQKPYTSKELARAIKTAVDR